MFGLIPTDKGFFEFLDQEAAVVVRAAQAFEAMSKDYGRRQTYIDTIRQCEHDGDELVHTALKKLDTTFLTPFDREDIHALLKQMDDIIDDIDAVSKRFPLYKVEAPTKYLMLMAEVLLQAAKLVAEGVHLLRVVKKTNKLHGILVEIHRLENVGDDHNHTAIEELFAQPNVDPLFVMKWKEIYEKTERAIDRCEDVANTMEAVALKNT